MPNHIRRNITSLGASPWAPGLAEPCGHGHRNQGNHKGCPYGDGWTRFWDSRKRCGRQKSALTATYVPQYPLSANIERKMADKIR